MVMHPQDVLDSQRQLAPRHAATLGAQVTSPTKTGGSRDGRRRATHNEGRWKTFPKVKARSAGLSNVSPLVAVLVSDVCRSYVGGSDTEKS